VDFETLIMSFEGHTVDLKNARVTFDLRQGSLNLTDKGNLLTMRVGDGSVNLALV